MAQVGWSSLSAGDQPPAVRPPLAYASAQVISLPPPPRGSRTLFFDRKSNRMYFHKFFSGEFIPFSLKSGQIRVQIDFGWLRGSLWDGKQSGSSWR